MDALRAALMLSYLVHDHVAYLQGVGVLSAARKIDRNMHRRGLLCWAAATALLALTRVRVLAAAYAREAALVARVRRLRGERHASSELRVDGGADVSTPMVVSGGGAGESDAALAADTVADAERELARAREVRWSVAIDAIKTLADLHVSSSMAQIGPLANTGLNRKVVAVLGLFSSLIALKQTWAKSVAKSKRA